MMDTEERGTGRTSRMVAEAVGAALEGRNVRILCGTPEIARVLVEPMVQADWARRVGTSLPARRIVCTGPEAQRGFEGAVFYDHTAL